MRHREKVIIFQENPKKITISPEVPDVLKYLHENEISAFPEFKVCLDNPPYLGKIPIRNNFRTFNSIYHFAAQFTIGSTVSKKIHCRLFIIK